MNKTVKDMKKQELIDYLQSCGVCRVCQLRYLKARGNEYRDIKKTFHRLDVKLSEEATDSDEDTADGEQQQPPKKPRLSNCCICLGLFSKDFQKQLIEGILKSNFAKYDSEGIVLALSLPMTLQLRQLSMWFALQRQFGRAAFDDNSAPDVPIKEAVKLILHPIVCAQLDRVYDALGLTINIDVRHSTEANDVDKLFELNKAAFPTKAAHQKRVEISRGLLEKQYQPSRIKAEVFEKYLPIPPPVVTESLQLHSIELSGPFVCVAGRYRKVSRQLSHTPWVLNGKRIMEDSIEEIIVRNVALHFSDTPEKITFMSSGREDVDVRCLGKGRPFVLEISNAWRTNMTRRQAFDMEQAVERSGSVSIHNLQVVPRDQLTYIKSGEEQKRKYYRALCVLPEPVTLDILQKLQISESFDVQQKTPIRVLHRRPLHTRPRTIFSVKTRVQRDNPRALIIDLVSQAGTYIKELVHGEFGRTTPSFTSIIGKRIDIIALDVVGIDLDWPADINNAENDLAIE